MRALAIIGLVALAACSQGDAPVAEGEYASESAAEPAQEAGYRPPEGSNDIFVEAVNAAPGHELIVTDLVLPPDAVGDAHYHPWEEYLYVIEGSAVLDIDGQDRRTLAAGEKFIIPRETVHTPVAGPGGIRAIVVRVHDEGDPVRVLAEEAEPEPEPELE